MYPYRGTPKRRGVVLRYRTPHFRGPSISASHTAPLSPVEANQVEDFTKIKTVTSKLILNGGFQAIQVIVTLSDGCLASAVLPSSVPFEISCLGTLEVESAPEFINSTLSRKLIGKDPCEQQVVDKILNESVFGSKVWNTCLANTILAVSLAVCKAGAMVLGIPLYQHIARLSGNKNVLLPVPSFVVDKFCILPVGASSFKEAVKIGLQVCNLQNLMLRNTSNVKENQVLELLEDSIKRTGYTGKVLIGDNNLSEMKFVGCVTSLIEQMLFSNKALICHTQLSGEFIAHFSVALSIRSVYSKLNPKDDLLKHILKIENSSPKLILSA